MNSSFSLIVLVFVICIGIVGINNAYAHKALIVGDFKLDVGWKTEPAIAMESNAIEVILSVASDFDKQRYDAVSFESPDQTSKKDITGLAKNLEVDVSIGNEKKIFLTLTEDTETPGTYYGEFTPKNSGSTKIHIYGKIKDSDFEATFYPEKVQENTQVDESVAIPDWIKNNAKWWADGNIGDSDFATGLQYLIQNHILVVPITQQESADSKDIPSWIKNNAGWWADGMISDDDFVKGIQYMITNGIILV